MQCKRCFTSVFCEAVVEMCVAGCLGVRKLRIVGELGGIRKIVIGPPVTSLTKRKRCFTSVFCSAVVSLRSSRPSSAEAWLSHTQLCLCIMFVL
uniref:SFRICE_025648 n=1 Tax=Spodoptera frugiperda TaxID=7108 RepID=A0A2H1VGI4_SPOFR